MWWAVVLGAAAMAIPLVLAVWRPSRATATRREIPPVRGVAARG
jgi:hypothetical protein